jgi:hypothetical protein
MMIFTMAATVPIERCGRSALGKRANLDARIAKAEVVAEDE